jgi:hypothetical protein
MWEKTKIEPQALESMPEIPTYLAFSLRSYKWLHSRRITEMGVTSISFRNVLDYLEFFELDLDVSEREELMHHIIAMESAYSKFKAKQKAQAQNGPTGKPVKSKH